MDQCDETGILYISGYYTTDGNSSAILAVDTATGELDGGVSPAQCRRHPL